MYMHTWPHTSMHTRMCAHTHARTHKQHTHTHTCTLGHTHTHTGEFKQYIEASRANLVANMNAEYGLYFAPYIDIFDVFYGYLQSTVETGNTCRMKEEWNEVSKSASLCVLSGSSTRVLF